MRHPVQQRVQEVNRRVRRWTVLHRIAISILLVGTAGFAVGLMDFLLRFEDLGFRLLGSAVVVAAVIYAARKYFWPACSFRPSDLQIAQWIESRYPDLHDRLSSSLAFVSQSEYDATRGSAELRRAVVAQAAADLESVDFDACVDARRPKRAVVLAAIVCAMLAAICWLDPASSSLAARRLALPWHDAPWPRRHNLAFVDPPTRLAVGSDLEIELIDQRGRRLPESVDMHFSFDREGQTEIVTKPMKQLNDRMVHRFENVQRSFRYRASGGDDDSMEWIELEVVEPPRVEQLQIRLHPPAYTGWPTEDSGENLHALEGTTVAISGRLNQPAASVSVVVATEEQEQKIETIVAGDGLSFALPADHAKSWVLEQSGRYWFEVTDLEGLGGMGQVWNLRVIPDSPPSVSLEKPSANTFVTATAIVSIEAAVKDDLAIRSIDVQHQRGDQAGDTAQSFNLFSGPDRQPSVDTSPLTSSASQGHLEAIGSAWDLSEIDGLTPGMSIELILIAQDYKPQSSQSQPRRLTIISAEELDERLAARQSYILGQLNQVLQIQKDVRSQTKSLEIQLDVAKSLETKDIDLLQSAELNQRQVGRLLSDPTDGVATQIAAVLEELTSNRIDSPETERRMNELLSVVRQISRAQLPEIQRQLVSALKLARTSELDNDDQTEAAADLTLAMGSAGRGQDEVITTLENLLGDLSQWDSYRRFAREISRVRRQQQTILEQTDQLRLDTLGKRPEDLSPQDKAGLKRQAERQAELARGLDRILGRMERTRKELEESEPLAAEMLRDALRMAQEDAIGGQMRESGRQLESNQVGQAVQTQQQVADALDRLLDTLANRREHELDRRLRGMKEADKDLQSLRDEAQTLRRKLEANREATSTPESKRELERLTRKAEELAEETRRLARRLQRLQANKSAESAEEGGSKLEQASQSGKQGQAGEAAEQARQAEQALEQAQQQLQQEQKKAEQDLFQEVVARLQQQIKGLVARQQGLLDTTVELEGIRSDQAGELTQAQQTTVRGLSVAQRSLAEETSDFADQVEQSKVFALGFRGVATEMGHAADQLEQQNTGETAQRDQRNALSRLEKLAEALQQDQKPPGEEQPPKPGGGDQQNQGNADAIRIRAELKLLKWLQLEINRQTMELEDLLGGAGEAEGDVLLRLEALAVEQGVLAGLMLDLSRETVLRPENGPDGLPDELEVPTLEGEPEAAQENPSL